MAKHDCNYEAPRKWSPLRDAMNVSRGFHSLVLLACGISIAAVASAAPVRWERAAGGNGHLYDVIRVGRQLHWEEARQAAKDLGPGWDLATITTIEESTFVKRLFGTDPRFFNLFPEGPVPRNGPWIGGFNIVNRNTFQWVTGEPVSFTDWGPFYLYSGRPISYADFSPPWGDGLGIAWNTPRYPFDFNSPIAYIAESSTPEPAGLVLRQSTVAGCRSVTGTVTIPQPAPPEGLVVNLSTTLDAASTPATLTILPGESSGTFTIRTTPVPAGEPETGTVSATLRGTTLSQQLTVRPMGMMLLTLSRSTVVGGYTVPGRAKLECRAAPGSITVDLESNDPALAAPVATSIVIPQGLQSESFAVTTHPALQTSSVSIKSTANGVVKATTLRLTPAATVSPKTLQFGDIATGSTSSLHLTLYNRGVLSFAIIGIGFSGSFSPFFGLGNNCPAQLAAGASCTIGIRMRPMLPGRRSATLSIATSATSSPLTVRVTGTGI